MLGFCVYLRCYLLSCLPVHVLFSGPKVQFSREETNVWGESLERFGGLRDAPDTDLYGYRFPRGTLTSQVAVYRDWQSHEALPRSSWQ